MPECVVIQPFDGGGKFDRRFEETFKPAIEAAGYDAYRVDRDYSVAIPIDAIEQRIRNCDACLVEITAINPNVWFEFGLAIAASRPVVIVCEAGAHSHLPFDVQHRQTIFYSVDSPSGYEKLRQAITEKLQAIQAKKETRDVLAASPLKDTADLKAHEISALIVVFTNGGDDEPGGVTRYEVVREMERLGYNKTAAILGLTRLKSRGFVKFGMASDERGNAYDAFTTTAPGRQWLLDNEEQLELRRQPPPDEPPDDSDAPF